VNEAQKQPRFVALPELRDIISDPEELLKGLQFVDAGGLARLARAQNKLFCDARGSSPIPYKVSITLSESTVTGRCTCMAARSRPFCKHASALLVAWARAPEAFAVSDRPPPDETRKKKEVKRGKVSNETLGQTGVTQVATLVRELAVAGVASVPEARIIQMRSLGENLRELKLRRLSGRTVALSNSLAESALDPATLDPLEYTGSVADMLLTARKLERHFQGEPLEPKHVEELIGKTWRKTDRTPVENLQIFEYAFFHRETADNFIIRESRFFDVLSGTHYSEKQIIPAMIAKRTEPKKSHAGRVLAGARGTVYPGWPPHRLELVSVGEAFPLAAPVLEAAVAAAHANIGSALTAFQAHKKDIFAPERLPLAIRAESVLATGRRALLADHQDQALFLPEDRALFDRLAVALERTKLRAVFGEAGLEGALPTFFPYAAIVEESSGLRLHSLLYGSSFAGTRKVRVEEKRKKGPVPWVEAARDAGASSAAIALGEIREELANIFLTGLSALHKQAAQPIAERLRDLNLTKQAELLTSLSERTDPAERLEDFVKIFSVLEIAVTRLLAAVHLEPSALTAVPFHESVRVKLSEGGARNRWEAAVHLTRQLDAATDEELGNYVYPAWADGSMSPFIVEALKSRPAAQKIARDILEDPAAGKTTKYTAEKLLGIDHLKPVPNLDRVTALLWVAPRGEQRVEAAKALASTPAAASALRLSFAGDVSAEVRKEALISLGKLRDPEIVETAIALLAARNDDPRSASAALAALAECGDVRALSELLLAKEERFRPQLVARALKAIGGPKE
jgi:hypothetical protein